MRFSLTIVAAGLVALGSAQSFGTKKDVLSGMQSTSPSLGLMPFIQMMLALGIVLVVIKFVLPKFAGKWMGKGTSSGAIKIEESTSFAGGNFYLVTAKGKTLLIGATTTNVACLADLTNPKIEPERELFMDILDHEQQNPSHLYVGPQGDPSPVMGASMNDQQIQEALERLGKLGL